MWTLPQVFKDCRTKNPYFFCSNRYVTRCAGCVRQINVQFLEQYLLFRLQEEADKQTDIQRVLVKANDEAKQKLAEVDERRKRLSEELKDLQTEETRLYETYALERKGREDYIKERQKLQEKIKQCMDMQQEMDGYMQTLKDKISEEESGIHEYVLSHGLTELTKEVVDRFVKKIVIYDEKNIEVEWNLDEISPETGMGVNCNAYNIDG